MHTLGSDHVVELFIYPATQILLGESTVKEDRAEFVDELLVNSVTKLRYCLILSRRTRCCPGRNR